MRKDGSNGTRTCVSCGSRFAGQFCSRCGERVVDRQDYSIPAFLREASEAITNLDNKVFRSLKYLLIRPGFLATEYVIGRRKPYLKPIQLFLLVNVVFFVFSTVTFNPFAHVLEMYVTFDNTLFPKVAERMVNERIQEKGIDKEAFAQVFDTRTEVISKALIIINVPLFALLLLVFFKHEQQFYVQHLAFAFHAVSAYLIMTMANVGGGMLLWRTTGNGIFQSDIAFTGPTVVVFLGYLILSTKCYYQQQLQAAIWKSLFLTLGFLMMVTMLYRTLLFFITMSTV